MGRTKLSAELLRREFVTDHQEAVRLVSDRQVKVNGSFALNVNQLVKQSDNIVLETPPKQFVSRGGEKLAHAIQSFGIAVEGANCIDIGSSTGGFTDCLLQRGAQRVTCVDVGYGLLHEKIISDRRVTVFERTNIKNLSGDSLAQTFDIVVVDLSFISLRTVMKNILSLANSDASIVMLIKPQFEATKLEASKSKGVIVDREIWIRTITEVLLSASEHGGNAQDIIVSPVPGKAGNKEFLLLISKQFLSQDLRLSELV
ncbi:MAG: TlyA family RNA methyltransferase [Actinomycetota bacterium]|nr:TlyA family RNA methyltransferase [Actinomycetota bacterium]MEC7116696.1 TlyA family RNA methyltransferase [Actinomycetota bacterium]MEC7608258.1 TlyA family RNA methyltransferase [Actinomycetota bacterium]MEC8120073.1 TlyA family RNA methyltransferase [Actinomycetota bacterium]